ncbi:unnamed protein product [Merluccius merluccius]
MTDRPTFPAPDLSGPYRDHRRPMWRCCGCGWAHWTTYSGLRLHQSISGCGWDSLSLRRHHRLGFGWEMAAPPSVPRRSPRRHRIPPQFYPAPAVVPSLSDDSLDSLLPPDTYSINPLTPHGSPESPDPLDDFQPSTPATDSAPASPAFSELDR